MKVFATYRNADMTEGRGPMVLDCVFLHKDHAEEYIDAQEGVMGRKQKWSAQKFGDWQVIEVEVIEVSLVDKAKKTKRLKASALKKLTAEEREALGLE